MPFLQNESRYTVINETKEVPVVIIDCFMILKAIKMSKNG